MMNDTERDALRRRILERLGWTELQLATCHPNCGLVGRGVHGVMIPAPDHTRDANAALRDLAPLAFKAGIRLLVGGDAVAVYEGPKYLFNVYHRNEGRTTDEAVALALSLAVDALPK